MFEAAFTYASATPLPPNISLDSAVEILHNFETVIKLSPDCRGCKSLPPPKNGKPTTNGAKPAAQMSYFEVEDDLPFMPKRLWSGGVKYNAEFVPVNDGCDITVHAPGGFTSTNHWRLLRDSTPIAQNIHQNSNVEHPETIPEDELSAALARVGTKDLAHAETESGGAGWYVEIISDAKCPRTFVGIIKGFLKNSHAQLQHAFIDRLKTEAKTPVTEVQPKTPDPATTPAPAQRPKPVSRPTLSRRRSSVL